jgi:hypothetical protein
VQNAKSREGKNKTNKKFKFKEELGLIVIVGSHYGGFYTANLD